MGDEAKKIKELMEQAIADGYDSIRIACWRISSDSSTESEIYDMGYGLDFDLENFTYIVYKK